MAVNFHDGAESSSISPLSFIGDSFHNNEGRHFSFLMDTDDVSLMGCDRPATSINSREGSNSIDSSGSYRRRIQGYLKRPSNPAPPSFSSQSSSSSSHLQLLTGVCVTPLELIQQSRAYRNRPPNNIYVRRCHSTQFSKGTDQRITSPSSLQQELQLLINHRREILTSLATIDENASTQKLELLCKLAAASGDAKNPTFVAIVVQLGELREQRRQHLTNLRNVESILQRLMKDTPNISPGILYKNTHNEGHEVLEGQWLTLTKPTYTDCLGFNDEGDPMYRLGRMSFEMFFPGDLICAIQAVFNPISKVTDSSSFSIPKALQEEVKLDLGNDDTSLLRTYHIVVAFTIEPYSPSFGQDSPNRIVSSPIKGIMTTYGYVLPDPTTPDRLSVWFAGGKISCGEDKTSHEFHIWKEIFGYPVTKKGRLRRRRRTFREGAMVFAAHMMMGAKGYDEPMDEDTGELSYTFTRPVGGHAKNYVDILHLDDNIRVMRGHAGTTYTFARLRS